MIRAAVILGNLGHIILIIGLAELSSLAWSLAYHENATTGIAVAAILTIACGAVLRLIFRSKQEGGMSFKESIALVTLGWIVASAFGCLPYIFSGYLPSFTDAWFETVSGFTTTGASVVTDIESWPKGLLFWRSLTQWLGGMGIIALFVAVISGMGVRANQMFRAEVPGPIADKISPRIRETARKLWLTYVVISLACALTLVVFGMNIFDALCHTFATLATGGFSTKNSSIAFYQSPAIQWTLIFFMFVAGASFTLHYQAFKNRKPRIYLRNPEFKLYAGIVLTATFIAALGLKMAAPISGWEETLRSACFQIVSMLTTTGFVSADYDKWPAMAAGMVFLVMFVGGCAGSTGGNIKPGRYLILFQGALAELRRVLHPRAVIPVRMGNRTLTDNLLTNVMLFFFLYILFLAAGILVLSMQGIDVLSSLTACATCLGNIGPGFGLVGPTRTFAPLPDLVKYTLSLLMLVGRLEIYPILVLFLPEYWRD